DCHIGEGWHGWGNERSRASAAAPGRELRRPGVRLPPRSQPSRGMACSLQWVCLGYSQKPVLILTGPVSNDLRHISPPSFHRILTLGQKIMTLKNGCTAGNRARLMV